jgi:hypothetical protein
MRKQYYFRPSQRGYFAWDVDRLVSLTSATQPRTVRLTDSAELDQPFSDAVPTYPDRVLLRGDVAQPAWSAELMDG